MQKTTLKNEIKGYVIQTLQDILGDPDFGLEFKENIKRRLRMARKSGGATSPLSEIKKRYAHMRADTVS